MQKLTQAEAAELSLKAATVFQPRAPISNRDFFAGRWEQITTIADAVAQTGLHIVIFGERGVGKTSLANVIGPILDVVLDKNTKTDPRLVVKVNTNHDDTFDTLWRRAFDEVTWLEERPQVGFSTMAAGKEQRSLRQALGISEAPTIDEVRKTLQVLKRSVFAFDEFDRCNDAVKRNFTDLIKALSDYGIDSTTVLVGVSDTIDQLVRDHASIVRAIVQIQLPRMSGKELKEILTNAEKALEIKFTDKAAALIITTSQGLPHYTHLIGLHATREASNRLSSTVDVDHVRASFAGVVKHAIQTIREKHLSAIHSAHKEALYGGVAIACALASWVAKDGLGYFHPSDVVDPLRIVLERDNVEIGTFQKHINEFCEPARGPILERAGMPRAYKYRFREPLLPPYLLMNAVAQGLVPEDIFEMINP